MLSLDRCRELLENPELSDDQILEIRDALIGFACLGIDMYLREQAEKRQRGQTLMGIEPQKQ